MAANTNYTHARCVRSRRAYAVRVGGFIIVVESRVKIFNPSPEGVPASAKFYDRFISHFRDNVFMTNEALIFGEFKRLCHRLRYYKSRSHGK